MQFQNAESLAEEQLSDGLSFSEGFRDPFSILANYLIAGAIVAIITLLFIIAQPKTCDWFILPAIFCGILMGADVVSWLRGQIDVFDPKGLIGCVVFYGFFLAPILHVFWNYYGPHLRFHDNPQHWLLMAIAANAAGLPLYKGAQYWAYKHTGPLRTTWRVVPQRILPVLACLAPVALGTWLYFNRLMWQSGAVEDFVSRQMAGQGTGWAMLFGGEFLGVLLLMGLISWMIAHRMDCSWRTCAVILFIGVVAQLLLTAFIGIRGLILQGIFWIAGLIHYYWRRLSIIYLLIGFICFLPFMYFYSFYKDLMQPEMLTSLKVIEQSKDLERVTSRNIHNVLLGDLARADVQARIASGIASPTHDYDLRYGQTYLFALSKLIPATIRHLFIDDPSLSSWSKGKAFIDLNEGKGFFDLETNWGTEAFGLGGEAMLNFGLLGVPVAWLFFGLILGIFRRKRDTLTIHDSRWALVPFLSYWLAVTPLWDLDVIVFGTVTGGFISSLCVFLWSSRTKKEEI